MPRWTVIYAANRESEEKQAKQIRKAQMAAQRKAYSKLGLDRVKTLNKKRR